jgi:hypothetical protein
MGLFHLKMACVDAIWRMFLKNVDARRDPNSFMRHIAHLRPRETGTLGSSPKFRPLHKCILHDGTTRRLDCWRVEVARRNPSFSSLDLYAASKPTWDELQSATTILCSDYVGMSPRIDDLRSKSKDVRDQQFKNNLLLNMYMLLYEELSYAMNTGDIGRVEACFIPWIPIFKATGKHKYASHMVKYLGEVHLVYPEPLRCAPSSNLTRLVLRDNAKTRSEIQYSH